MLPRKRKANKNKAKVPEVANDDATAQWTVDLAPDMLDNPDDIADLDGGHNADVGKNVDVDDHDATVRGQTKKKKKLTWWSGNKSKSILFNNRLRGFREKIFKQKDWDKCFLENFKFLKSYISDVKRMNAVSVSTPTYILQCVIQSTYCFSLIVKDWWDGVNNTVWTWSVSSEFYVIFIIGIDNYFLYF